MTESLEAPYFGGCPKCRKTDGYMNVHKTHWFVCDAHMTKWCIGYGLFSCWEEENEGIWTANAKKLEAYTEVEPVIG